jgi:hypothetical protein
MRRASGGKRCRIQVCEDAYKYVSAETCASASTGRNWISIRAFITSSSDLP